MLEDLIQKKEGRFRESDYPKVSVIVPSLNSSTLISSTLESIIHQDYPDLEILVIDAGSSDRTLEIIKNFKDSRLRLYSVSEFSLFTMLNKGITHAYGAYINFLFPGDNYIHKHTIREMMNLALEHAHPSLVYCGTLLRDGRQEVKILYRTLSIPLLKTGKQPTSLQSCWFKSDIFRRLGKFNTQYKLRSSFDLMCRISLDEGLTVQSTHRILTDFDLRFVTRTLILRHFFETMLILNHYFGLWTVITWFFKQRDLRYYMRMWSRSLRVAFLGK